MRILFQIHGEGQGNSILSVPLAKKLIDGMAAFPDKLKMIRICGFGEPLVNPNIVEIVKYMHEKNCANRIVLITNGSLLRTELSENLVKYVDHIIVSVNGLNAEQIMKFTNTKINYEKYYNGIKELCSYAENEKCTICAKIHNEAVQEKSDLEKFYKMYGDICDEVTVETLSNMYPESVYEGMDMTKHRFACLEKMKVKCCPQIFKSMQVYADGVVVACCVDHKSANVVGNLKDESLLEIWNGNLLKALQIKHLNLMKDHIPFCNVCSMNDYSEVDNIDNDIDDIKKRMGI